MMLDAGYWILDAGCWMLYAGTILNLFTLSIKTYPFILYPLSFDQYPASTPNNLFSLIYPPPFRIMN